MLEIITRNKIVVALIIVAVAAVFWWMLAPAAPVSDQVLTTEGAPTASDSDIVASLLQLHAVTLSDTLFSDAAFLSLRDFGVDITNEDVGRPNPFAPLLYTPPTSGNNRQAQIFAPNN